MWIIKISWLPVTLGTLAPVPYTLCFPFSPLKEFEIFAWVKYIDGKKIFTESLIKSDELIHVESSAMFIDLGLDAAEFFAPDKNYP